MNIKQHHLLCLGLLAKIYWNNGLESPDDFIAIREAFESAEELDIPVSVEKLESGEPVATNQPWDFEKL